MCTKIKQSYMYRPITSIQNAEQLFAYKLGGQKSTQSAESPTNFRHLAQTGEPMKCEKKFRI